jgi:hypothetical protein
MRSMSRAVVVIASCAAIMVFSGCAPKYADISGTVYYYKTTAPVSTTPLVDSDISLIEGSSAVDTQVTDASGRYAFADVDPGTYSIRAYLDKVPNLAAPVDHSYRVDGGSWTSPIAIGPEPFLYFEYSGLTVAAGDDVTVDFRLAGY